MFDQCPKAVKIVKGLKTKYSVIKSVDQATMQGYEWKKEYNAIILRWCAGYLNDEELAAFLRKARNHLDNPQRRVSRQSTTTSFIFLLDNVV